LMDTENTNERKNDKISPARSHAQKRTAGLVAVDTVAQLLEAGAAHVVVPSHASLTLRGGAAGAT